MKHLMAAIESCPFAEGGIMCAAAVIRRALVVSVIIGLSRERVAENWPQWRGPTDNRI